MKTIILAGGLGTRLAPLTKSTPKPLVSILEKPLLYRVIKSLNLDEISDEIIVSAGHLGHKIEDYLKTEDGFKCPVTLVIEKEKLGTGGAINFIFDEFKLEEALVTNGDTLFITNDLNKVIESDADFTIGTIYHHDCSRYGIVSTDKDGKVIDFKEKIGVTSPGVISGGVYKIKENAFNFAPDTVSYSLETQLIPILVKMGQNIQAKLLRYEYFNDIADADCLAKANKDYRQLMSL